jgi:hypothetical protein
MTGRLTDVIRWFRSSAFVRVVIGYLEHVILAVRWRQAGDSGNLLIVPGTRRINEELGSFREDG